MTHSHPRRPDSKKLTTRPRRKSDLRPAPRLPGLLPDTGDLLAAGERRLRCLHVLRDSGFSCQLIIADHVSSPNSRGTLQASKLGLKDPSYMRDMFSVRPNWWHKKTNAFSRLKGSGLVLEVAGSRCASHT